MADRQVTVKVAIKPAEADPLRKVFQKIRDESVATERGISRDLGKLRESYKPLFPGAALGAGGSGVGAALAKAFGGGTNAYGGLSAPNLLGGGKLGGLKGPTSGLPGTITSLLGGSAGAGAAGALAKAAPFLAIAQGVKSTVDTIIEVSKALYELGVATASLASPGTVKLLEQTFDDLGGVIGRVAVPFVETITAEFRLLGDVLATILPSTEEMRAALAPLNDVLADLRDWLAEIAPLLKLAVVGALQAFAYVLREVLYPLRFVTSLLRELGIIGGSQLNSSLGAAARPVSTHSDAVAFARQTYQDIASNLAAQGGGAAPKTAVDEAAAAAKECAESLKEIFGWLKSGKETAEVLPGQAASGVWNITGGIVRAMTGF